MWRYLILGFLPFHNSTSVLGTDFDGTKFRRYDAFSRAYPQKEIGKTQHGPYHF
jgi:hypothetical protein